jgi:hypothetical protein
MTIVAKNEHNLTTMKQFSVRRTGLRLWLISLFGLCGCASHTTETAKQLDKSKPEYQSRACQQTLGEVWIHQDIKNVTTVATPVLAFAAGPVSAIPLLMAHVGLGAADRVDAATLASRCGGPAPGVVTIGAGIASDAALGILGGSAGAAVGKTLPAPVSPAPSR